MAYHTCEYEFVSLIAFEVLYYFEVSLEFSHYVETKKSMMITYSETDVAMLQFPLVQAKMLYNTKSIYFSHSTCTLWAVYDVKYVQLKKKISNMMEFCSIYTC